MCILCAIYVNIFIIPSRLCDPGPDSDLSGHLWCGQVPAHSNTHLQADLHVGSTKPEMENCY